MSKAPSKRKPQKSREFLASYLPYLLNRVTREMLKGVDEKFAQRGLNVPKWRVLAVLSDRGACRFGELVEVTSIEPATLSRFIGTLVEEGLVVRERSTTDARAVDVALTPRGEAAFQDTLAWAAGVEDRIVRGLSAAEIKKLKSVLDTLYANIREGDFADLDAHELRPAVSKATGTPAGLVGK
jgi:DNA-binding MarR family transcriptional regulator